jgi:hypothetical protein
VTLLDSEGDTIHEKTYGMECIQHIQFSRNQQRGRLEAEDGRRDRE